MNYSSSSTSTVETTAPRFSATAPMASAESSFNALTFSDHENRLHFFDRFTKVAAPARLTPSTSLNDDVRA